MCLKLYLNTLTFFIKNFYLNTVKLFFIDDRRLNLYFRTYFMMFGRILQFSDIFRTHFFVRTFCIDFPCPDVSTYISQSKSIGKEMIFKETKKPSKSNEMEHLILQS